MATALYRRYRPESFAEVIGQDHVTTPLRRALRAGRIGHAYLFSGPRGCGKTTSARILARCLNCVQGPTDVPCGQCDSCRDLANGGAGSLDVVEIDAASHGGVDDARELRERASFAPVRDRFKVFIIDEAHMVTSAGFNALLKLVEEPPEHVKFVFATTEPDKVIGTIRSRTHHYPFRLIPPQVLGPYLEEVCAAEQVQVGEGVMPLVVRAGGGSARDSMSVLDQLMAGAGDEGIDFPTAIALLGFTDTALLDTAVTAVAERDAAALYAAVEHVLATGHEPRRFVEDLLERMRDLIVLAAVPDKGADLLPQVPADELESMRGQAALFAPADLSQCGDLVHETLSTMSGATSPRLHLELLAARLVLRHERAALVAGDAGAPAADPRGGPSAAEGRPGAPSGPGERPGAAQAGPSTGRQEARRIAQEKVEAARQARGGRPGGAPAAPARPAADAPSQADGPADQAASGQGAPQDEAPSQGAAVPWGAAVQTGQDRPGPQARQDQDPQIRQDQAAQPPAESAPRPGGQQPWGDAVNPPQSARPQEQPAHASGQPAPASGQEGTAQPPTPQATSTPAQPTAAGGLDVEQVRGHWSAILDELQQIRRPSWALISQNATVNGARGTTLVIGFRTEGLLSAFHRGTGAENLADAVRRIMHTEVTVEAVVGEDPGPGGGQDGPGAPGGSGPGGPGASGRSGPGGPGAPGGAGPGGPSAPGGPGPGGGPAPDGGRTPAGSGPAPWGDAVASMAPRGVASAPSQNTSAPIGEGAPDAPSPGPADPAAATRPGPSGSDVPEEQPPVSAGQRASERALQAAARAAQANRGGPAPERVEDFAPEPDDPYPPDPEDEYLPRGPREDRQSPGHQGGEAGWSAAAPSTAAPSGAAASGAAPSAAAPAAAAPSGVAPGGPGAGVARSEAPDGEIPVVEDEGRDSLPPEESRTYGQNALRRALAEGRVVHSRPAQRPDDATSSSTTAPGSFSAPGDPSDPAGASMMSAAPAASSAPGTSSAPSVPSASSAPAMPSPSAPTGEAPESASARAAVAWGTAGTSPSATAAPSAPPATAPPVTAPSAAEAPRSGAALAREAAQASRSAAQRGRGSRGPASAPEAEADPTGGATRDDEDATMATRNGREVVEKLLGGKVLEIIDETGAR